MKRMLSSLAALIVPGGLVFINTVNLLEAYGGGPPYYGRTTNMDKWADPLPWLMGIDATGLIIIIALLWLGWHRTVKRS